MAAPAADGAGLLPGAYRFLWRGFPAEREGQPFCILHPEDAAKRGLKDGDRVRLFNDRGEIGLMLKVADEVQPGVLLVPGQRPVGEAVSGTIKMLCSDATPTWRRRDLPEHLAGSCALEGSGGA